MYIDIDIYMYINILTVEKMSFLTYKYEYC